MPAAKKDTTGFCAVNPIAPALAPVPPKFQDHAVGLHENGVLTDASINPTVPPTFIAVAPVFPLLVIKFGYGGEGKGPC